MFRSSMLRSKLCGYSDSYNVIKGTRTAEGTNYATVKKAPKTEL